MKAIEVKTKTPYDFDNVTTQLEVRYHYAEVAMVNLINQLRRQLEINEELGRQLFSPADMFETACAMLDGYVTINEKES